MSLKKISAVSNFTAGSTCTIDVPRGSSYNKLFLYVTGATNAQVTNIKVKINAKTIQEFKDLDELDAINTYYGRPFSGCSTLFFERPELIEEQRRVCAIGTLDIASFTIEMDIAAAAAAPVLKVVADTDLNVPLGMITKIIKFPVPTPIAGRNDIDKIPKAGKLAAIHFGKADVNELIIERDTVFVTDATKAELEQDQKIYDRVPLTASHTHADFIRRGNISEALEVMQYSDGRPVQDLRARVELAAAGTVDMICEYFDSLSGVGG